MTLAKLAQRRANNTGNTYYVVMDRATRKQKVVAKVEKYGPFHIVKEFTPDGPNKDA